MAAASASTSADANDEWVPIHPITFNSAVATATMNRMKVAERTMTYCMRETSPRLTEYLTTIATPPPFSLHIAAAVRWFLRETSATPANGIIAPVTVADYAGRFAPAVLLVRLTGGSWKDISAAVAAALAPVHVLAPNESLVRLPTVARRSVLVNPVIAPILPVGQGLLPVVVYVGADAERHARNGNLFGPSIYTMGDPNANGHATRRDRNCSLVYTVMPMSGMPGMPGGISSAQDDQLPNRRTRTMFPHEMRVEDGRTCAIPCGLPCHVPEATEEAVALALRPYSQEGIDLESAYRVRTPPGTPRVFWSGAQAAGGEEHESPTPEFLRAIARRVVVPASPELEAERRAQANFFELLDAALNCLQYYADSQNTPISLFDVAVNRQNPALVRLTLRVFARSAAGVPSIDRTTLRGITATSPAWAAVDQTYLPLLLRHANYVAAGEDVLLRFAEEVSLELTPARDPSGLTVGLNEGQSKSLSFMMAAEDAAPLATTLAFPLFPPSDETTGPLPSTQWSPYFRDTNTGYGAVISGTDRPLCPRPRRGGIVANQAGTGKTILTLALVLARPPLTGSGPGSGKATLVLCPPSIVTQWVAEAARAAPHLRVIAARPGHVFDMPEAAQTHDVVVCGFPAMFTTRAQNICAASWHRLVVDEAHLARNHVSALEHIQANRAWCLSGTPFGAGGSTRDLEGLMRIATGFTTTHVPSLHHVPGLRGHPLRLAPATFKNMRMLNLANAWEVAPFLHLTRMLVVRFPLALGNQSGSGPQEAHDLVVAVPLPEDAQVAYARLEAESRADITNLTNRTRELMTRPLLRLRDWCAGAARIHRRIVAVVRPPRAPRDASVASDDAATTIGVPYSLTEHGAAFNDPETDTCSVCLEPLLFARLAMPPCRHWFCVPCIRTAVSRWSRCPTCRKPATLATLRVQPEAEPDEAVTEAVTEVDAEADAEADAEVVVAAADADAPTAVIDDGTEGGPPSVFAAKVAALVALAGAMNGEKFIVFTRMTSLARPYAEALTAAGVPSVYYTRHIPERERNANKALFVASPTLRAIVLDLDNAEGIDGLQTARRVVFCEPFPATDGNKRSQAVSRCIRLGQTRAVIVRTLAFTGTAEERLATYFPPRSTPPIRRVRHYVGA